MYQKTRWFFSALNLEKSIEFAVNLVSSGNICNLKKSKSYFLILYLFGNFHQETSYSFFIFPAAENNWQKIGPPTVLMFFLLFPFQSLQRSSWTLPHCSQLPGTMYIGNTNFVKIVSRIFFFFLYFCQSNNLMKYHEHFQCKNLQTYLLLQRDFAKHFFAIQVGNTNILLNCFSNLFGKNSGYFF